MLTRSAAKTVVLADIVGCELEVRGDRLRALVLCDSERPSAAGDGELAGVLDLAAGSALAGLEALANDVRTAVLRPLLVSGRGLRCAGNDAAALLEALRADAPAALDGWREDEEGDGFVRLSASGTAWQPRLWVQLATTAFAAGATKALVGTRALLGEGWDAPCVNCLVDLSETTTAVSVTQMRGRSLRLDPADPTKMASNWDVVCVAAGLARAPEVSPAPCPRMASPAASVPWQPRDRRHDGASRC
ncbi:MAG TPA: hypothetical protein VMD59_15140 [Acidimicrobiales bacterium]|nr:hypothetical protein [Acidimicrobiales bacterium]